MPRAQIEIDIPDDCEICKGPVFSSALWNDDIRARPETGVIHFHVVVCRKWQWPNWLLCDWIAEGREGEVTLGCGTPTIGSSIWYSERYRTLTSKFLALNLPPCTDWRQSLRLNPNREAKS